MNIRKIVLPISVLISTSFSLDITISGKVTDTGTTPLPNAAVKLEKYGLTTTSDINGDFTLTGSVDINNTKGKLQNNKLSAHIGGNGVLFLDIRQSGLVEIVTYTLLGKAVSRINQVMDIGTHRIAQPNLGSGVYVYRVKSGCSELLIKSHSIGRVSNKKEVSDKGGSSSTVFVKRPGRAPIDDVIAVTKDGYLNYRVIVTNSDTGNIEIKMIVCADTVRDIDGNLYQAVRIGDQVWTVENLRVTRYIDGTAIPLDTSAATWANATTEKYCYYKNKTDADSIRKLGALYNWYVVSSTNPKKIAPTGWHVPTDADCETLKNCLIANGYNWDGTTTGNKIAKSMAARTDWQMSFTQGMPGNNPITNNCSGFSALPSGYRYYNGYFFAFSEEGILWSVTENDISYAWCRDLYYEMETLGRTSILKSCGLSIRLVRD